MSSEGHVGRGEAAGVYYKKDTPALMREEVEALDCAPWGLEAK